MKQLQNGRTAICRHYCICVLKVAVSCSVFVDKGSKHTITGNKIRCPDCRLKAGSTNRVCNIINTTSEHSHF